MKMEKIGELMHEEHRRLKEVFDESMRLFEKDLRDPEVLKEAQNTFSKLKWAVQKHFFVEEKAIFSAYQGNENKEDMDRLIEQHNELLQILTDMEDNLTDGAKPDTSEFKRKILDHADFEDDFFYPKLDELLDDHQKTEISIRIREVIKE